MKLHVDPPELHKAAGTFSTLAEDYHGVYTRLMNTASTMGEAWKAADNLAFVDQINGFCEDLNKMVAHLNQASAALTQQAQNYEKTRDDNVAGVRTLTN